MTVERPKPKPVTRLDVLYPGGVFEYNGIAYIACGFDTSTNTRWCVDLELGERSQLDNDTMVTPYPRAKLVLEP